MWRVLDSYGEDFYFIFISHYNQLIIQKLSFITLFVHYRSPPLTSIDFRLSCTIRCLNYLYVGHIHARHRCIAQNVHNALHTLSGMTIKSLINVNGVVLHQFTNVSRLFYVLRREFNNSLCMSGRVCVRSGQRSLLKAYSVWWVVWRGTWNIWNAAATANEAETHHQNNDGNNACTKFVLEKLKLKIISFRIGLRMRAEKINWHPNSLFLSTHLFSFSACMKYKLTVHSGDLGWHRVTIHQIDDFCSVLSTSMKISSKWSHSHYYVSFVWWSVGRMMTMI